jgi:hypothetical protein
MMKKVFLSLLLAIACVPMAFSQTKAGDLIVTDTAVCGSYTWPVNNVTYNNDTSVIVLSDSATYVLHLTAASTTVDTAVAHEITGNCFVNWNNKRWVSNGTYIDTIHVAGSCDTIVKVLVNLTIPHPDTTTTVVNASCSYTWGDEVITEAGIHTRTYLSTEGCDSIVALNINFSGVLNKDTTIVACERYILNNDTITSDTTYIVEDSTASCHIYTTVHLTIAHGVTDTTVVDTIGGCSIAWGGQTYGYTSAGNTYYANIHTVNGCDSIVGLHIVAFDSVQYTTIVSNEERCAIYNLAYSRRKADGSYENRTASFTADGIYTTAPNGDTLMRYDRFAKCLTYQTLDLNLIEVVDRVRDYVVDTVVCDKYVFAFNDNLGNFMSFTESVDTILRSPSAHENAASCYDSVAHFIVVVNHKHYRDTVVSACESFTWDANGTTYTSSTVDSIRFSTRTVGENCDSIGRLRLTINRNPEVHIEGDWHVLPGETAHLKAVYNVADHPTFQWYKNGVAIPASQNGTSDSIDVTESTNTDIRLESTSDHGCVTNNWITVTFLVGIDDVEGMQVNIYPNPASRFINIESADAISQVVIYNAIGQQVISRPVNGTATQLDLSNLSVGTYTMAIISANGDQATRKFIVNK